VKAPLALVALSFALILALSSCTNPYDPGQRAVGGGLIGAGAGALVGAAAGAPGTGALIGGALGAVAGAVTTPPPPAYAYGRPYRRYASRRCGRHYHWVAGHRNRRGYWVRAHCARNW
jgi:hypothetical protein